ncbi:tetratricopeptide repeat protein [Nonomuraea sp. NPDC048826]|uniref:tetratricopeptide repeat protein n=1 Tax=Nonomuraea sp. NPDC048826 TaxID=3364347 RepID=UPI00370FFF8F
MRPGRVVDVTGALPGGKVAFGSGCLVGGDLVLTARHLVLDPATGRPLADLEVRTLADAHGLPCEVAWPGTGRLDAALLRITSPRGPRPNPVRWGQLVSASGRVSCEAIGFPQAMEQPRGLRDTERFTGTVNVGTGLLGGRLHASADDQVPARGGWQGMSGAALWAGRLLIGVVVEDPVAWRSRRLVAEPVSLLWAEPGFREALGRAAVLESVEFARPVRVAARSPAYLLRADAQTVRFRARTTELAALAQWCDGGGVRVRLLTGPGGQGKTRLVTELCQRLEQDPSRSWVTSWWGDRPAAGEEARRAALERPAGPVLVVLDYAETRPDVVAEVVRSAQLGGDAPVRVLLLARSAGDWWQRLIESDSRLEQVLDAAVVEELAPLEREPVARAAAYQEALTDLEAALTAMDWPHRPSSSVPTPDLEAARFTGAGAALSLQMSALAGLLGEEPEPGRPVEEVVLRHEARYWRDTARHHRLSVSEPTFRRAVAVASLCGAAAEPEAVDLLRRVPWLGDQHEDALFAVARWLRDLYPASGGGYWGSLQPDRLAEHLAAALLRECPGLLGSLAAHTSTEQDFQALTVLARASARHRDIAPEVAAMVAAHPVVAATAMRVATQSEDPSVLLAGLSALLRDDRLSAEHAAMLSDLIPEQTRALSGFAADIGQAVVDAYETRAGTDPDVYLPILAGALNNLSIRLGALGRREEGLAAVRRATGIQERLAEVDSDAYLPDLANSLNNLSVRLAALGRHEEGLPVIRRATDIRERLAAADPDTHLPDLARSLNNLSIRLGDLGRPEEGLAAIQRATDIYERLAAADPDTHLPDLARSLNNLSIRLGDLGRAEEGLAAIQRATDVCERLAAANPDAYLPDLANSLNNQCIRLSGLGRDEEALTAARRATEIRERLAEAHPDAYLPDLANSLNNLSVLLGTLGHHDEGLAAGLRSTGIRERLAATDPDAYLPHLALSLNNLSIRLGDLGRPEEGLAAIRRATDIRERLAAANPDAHLPNLANSLNNLSVRLADLGRREEGVEVARRAAGIFGRLAEARPDAYLPDLATSLVNLAIDLAALGRGEESATVADRAVRLRRDLAEAHPDVFLTELAVGCYTVATLDNATPARDRIALLIEALTIAQDRDHAPLASSASAVLRGEYEEHPDDVRRLWTELTGTEVPAWLT